MPEELNVGRGDPAYMAHAYLTKIPVPAIRPFIEAYTEPGDVVLDPFAGSGMTGVAAVMAGRRARLFDISVLGRHIGRNYVNFVDANLLAKHAEEVVESSRRLLHNPYLVRCQRCGEDGQLAKAVCSFVVECGSCGERANYYRSLEAAQWSKSRMKCPHCGTGIGSKNRRVGDESVIDWVNCGCSAVQLEQGSGPTPIIDTAGLDFPDVEISPDRQMYQASALGKHGLTTIASFYSPRNFAVLASLRQGIRAVEDETIRDKLMFAFTACLTRASRRYQWSRQRPLNAANANYYVAMIFYEWNVYDLFLRKVQSAIRSDEWVSPQGPGKLPGLGAAEVDVEYELASADACPLADASVDYVFTDPPFGSNLFYADMAMFQEAWLGSFTDVTAEAVVDRGKRKVRTPVRYEQLLTGSLSECRRVLKTGGRISMVFGNSSGSMWALVQRAIRAAGLEILPDALVVLNKGQRSVKGLASGFEHVATLDLVITMRATIGRPDNPVYAPDAAEIASTTRSLAQGTPASPSHVYLELLRYGIRHGWDLSALDLRTVTSTLVDDGWGIDEKTGRIIKPRAVLS